MYLRRELRHLWKTVAPAFGAEHDLSRADSWELITGGGGESEDQLDSGLSLIAYSFSDAGDLQDQLTHFTMELPLPVVQSSERPREESEWEWEELWQMIAPCPQTERAGQNV